MYIPASLKPGDTIGFVCTARKLDLDSIQVAIRFFEKAGFKVLIGDSIGAEYFQYAGDDNFRRKDLQKMLDNPKVKAIISARGGYGTVRIIDDIYYGNYLEIPKWIIGYSDITALHSHLNHVMGIGTLHASMPVSFDTNTPEALQSILDALTGKPLKYSIDSHPLNRIGKASGEIVGGNLSVLYSLLGTKTLLHTANKILFLEDLDEYLYHVDRMMIALKRAGKLNQLAGIIVGGMTNMHDNEVPYGKTAEEIILEHVEEFDYPVCFGFPAGHIDDNRALKFGAMAQLNVTEKGVEFNQ